MSRWTMRMARCAAWGLALGVATAAGAQPSNPNVLIVFADDVGWGDIRCYQDVEGAMMKTPHIDALAATGLRFTDAHSRALCAPSRYSILTGNYPSRSPGLGWEITATSSVAPGQKTMATLFQELGYHTGFIGKWHMGGRLQGKDGKVLPSLYELDWNRVDWSRPMHRGPTRLGFDYSFMSHSGVQAGPYACFENDSLVGDPEQLIPWKEGRHENKDNPYHTFIEKAGIGLPDWDSSQTGEQFTRKALAFIDRHVATEPDRPFFLHFCSQAIHTPMTPGEFMGTRVEGATGSTHTDMLYELDLQVGALIDRLKTHGLLENTLVIFTSDNGAWEDLSPESYDSSAHRRGRKGEAYEGGHRVPFIVRWGDGTEAGSRIAPGRVCDQLIDQTDLLPSFAATLGGQLGPGHALDGVDVSPYFFGDESRVLRDSHYAKGRMPEGSWDPDKMSYRKDGYKIIASQNKDRPQQVLEMYHLADDPSEEVNLAANPEYETKKNQLMEALTTLVTSKPTSRKNAP